MTVETRYMRNDLALLVDNTVVGAEKHQAVADAYDLDMRVRIFFDDVLKATSTTAGPWMLDTGPSEKSATANVPATVGVHVIKVKVDMKRWGFGTWITDKAIFTSNDLGGLNISAGAWTVYLNGEAVWVDADFNSIWYVYYGSPALDSRVEGIEYFVVSAAQPLMDGFVFAT